MKCSCIKGDYYDFYLEPVDCKRLLYQDQSIWMEGDSYIYPESYDLFINVGGGAGKKITVKTGILNVIDNQLLGGAKDLMLPDGLITFRVESCNKDQYVRYRMNTCKLECCLMEYIAQAVEHKTPMESDVYSNVEHITRLINTSKAYASRKDYNAAVEVYEEAKIAIEDLNCKCKCLDKP